MGVVVRESVWEWFGKCFGVVQEMVWVWFRKWFGVVGKSREDVSGNGMMVVREMVLGMVRKMVWGWCGK